MTLNAKALNSKASTIVIGISSLEWHGHQPSHSAFSFSTLFI
jgi:hypothetical protein